MYTHGARRIHGAGDENAEWKLDISKYTGDDGAGGGDERGPTVRETRASALKYHNDTDSRDVFTGALAGALTTVAR